MPWVAVALAHMCHSARRMVRRNGPRALYAVALVVALLSFFKLWAPRPPRDEP